MTPYSVMLHPRGKTISKDDDDTSCEFSGPFAKGKIRSIENFTEGAGDSA
jgi:hypothetical protein